MSRQGSEPKLPWFAVPPTVKSEVARLLGSPVARAERIYGGYSPSATFRIRLADGRRAFFKGIHAGSNGVMREALIREERVYQRLDLQIRGIAPSFFGSFRNEDWHVLLLEDLGPATPPPWSARRTQGAATAYARFHLRTLGRPLPSWLPRETTLGFAPSWRDLARSGNLAGTASLAGRRQDEAREWLDVAFPDLDTAARRTASPRPPLALLHLDTRSDNVRLQPDGGLRIFDWPFACVGPVEFEVAAFAQSIACEGGPAPERFIEWYARTVPIRSDVLRDSVAAIAGYFAAWAWRAPLPGLPRLRSIQRRQLKTSLPWAARLLDLPDPEWLRAVKD